MNKTNNKHEFNIARASTDWLVRMKTVCSTLFQRRRHQRRRLHKVYTIDCAICLLWEIHDACAAIAKGLANNRGNCTLDLCRTKSRSGFPSPTSFYTSPARLPHQLLFRPARHTRRGHLSEQPQQHHLKLFSSPHPRSSSFFFMADDEEFYTHDRKRMTRRHVETDLNLHNF